MHMPPLLSQIENHEVEATRAATTAKGYFSARTVRSDRYRLLNMPVATCPRIIPLSRGRALWARAWPRKYFLYTFLSPSPLSPLSSLSFPPRAFHFSPSQRVSSSNRNFPDPSTSFALIILPLYSVLRVIADAHARGFTQAYTHTITHSSDPTRTRLSYPIYTRYIYRYIYVWYIYIYVYIRYISDHINLAKWAMHMLMATEGFRQAAKRNGAGRKESESVGVECPLGIWVSFLCICMHMYAHACNTGRI